MANTQAILSRGEITMDISRFLIGVGLVLLVAGFAWPLIARLGLGRLSGDIVVQRGHATIFIPIVTCLLLSAVASAVLWLINR